MKQRQVRLLPIVQSMNSSNQIVSRGEPVVETARQALASSTGKQSIKPAELTWWDWAVFLLHTAAEVEHALMVQYLYAGYSLKETVAQGPGIPLDADRKVKRWRREILQIAREEMGHFITVQNLLRFIGGPLNFDREDFPIRNLLYPFPFELEPLTKNSLAKYIVAEMPENPDQPPELINTIKKRAVAQVGSAINRIGVLYDQLIELFKDSLLLVEDNFRSETTQYFQAKAKDWSLEYYPLIRSISSRDEAILALEAIAAEGEGNLEPNQRDQQASHFERFLGIYNEFPEIDDKQWPTHRVPVNPNTFPDYNNITDGQEVSRITDPLTCLWANLFNVRYRMLLLDLRHSLSLKRPEEITLCSQVRSWAFFEMRGSHSDPNQGQAGLRGIAQKLTSLPLKEQATTDDDYVGGATFELPYTLYTPDETYDWWQLHLALIDVSAELIEKIKKDPREKDYGILTELTTFDEQVKITIVQELSYEPKRIKPLPKKPDIKPLRMKGAIGFEEDIKPLFQPSVACMMRKQLNLADWWQCRDRAQEIYQALASGVMPPGETWSQQKVELFNVWMLEGCPKYRGKRYSAFFRKLDAHTEYWQEYGCESKWMNQYAKTIFVTLLPAWVKYAAVSHTDEGQFALKEIKILLKKPECREAVQKIDDLLYRLALKHFRTDSLQGEEAVLDAFEHFGRDKLPLDIRRANLAIQDGRHPPDAPLYHRIDRPIMWFNWVAQLELGRMTAKRDLSKDKARTILMAGLTLGCSIDFLFRDYTGAAQLPRTRPDYKPDQSTITQLRIKAKRLSSQWDAAVREMHELYRIFRGISE